MANLVCFANNRDSIQSCFRDYFYEYMAQTDKNGGYVYDKSISFAEKEKKVNAAMMKEITRLSGINMESASVSTEMLAQNPTLRWATFAVVNDLVDFIVPDVIDRSIGVYTEQRYGAFGDSFSFTIEPNDLFYVSKVGRDQRTTEFQKQFPGQVTVTPEARGISVAVSLYKVLCGKESLAKFAMKAALSLEAQITKEVYTAFNTAMEAIPFTSNSVGLNVHGWSQDSAVRVAQTVSAYNHGAEAIFLGTKLALNKVMPMDANYRYDFDSDYVKVGYVRDFMGYSALEMRQVADWKNPYNLILNDNRIYIISPSTPKPVKLCYEGSAYTVNLDHDRHADFEASTTLFKSYGIAIATNATVGVVMLDQTAGG